MLETTSCCKINLLLNILGKRPDGFHELETIMHPIALHDRLTFEETGSEIVLTCSDPSLPVDGKNLVYRAAESFRNRTGIRGGVKIHLKKNLPIAAGMGGGSGNAAVTFTAMNELFGTPLTGEELYELAAALGSDIPFFLQKRPALATGRGELVVPLEYFPAFAETWVVLIHPGFGVSTPWAYQELARYPEALNGQPGRADNLLAALRAGNRAGAAREFYNSLEAPVLHKYPLLEVFQSFLRDNGAWASLMSGSGSTTFAFVETQMGADVLLEKIRAQFGDTLWTAAVKMNPGEDPV